MSESKIKIPYNRFSPEYKQKSYSPKDALSFAIASEVVYSNSQSAKRKFKSWGFDQCEYFDVTRGNDIDTQGVIAKNEKYILAVFRGSEKKLPDWLTNFQIWKDPAPLNGAVHGGFQDSFLAASYEIGHCISQLHDNNQQIWITGHSLGGALATLMTATLLDFKNSKIKVSGIYTFGAPRVGDHIFAGEFNRRMNGTANFRVINSDDLVPHLPPETLSFRHTGNRILLDNSGSYSSVNSNWKEEKKNMWSWIGGMGRKILKIGEPHKLASNAGYINHLRKI